MAVTLLSGEILSLLHHFIQYSSAKAQPLRPNLDSAENTCVFGERYFIADRVHLFTGKFCAGCYRPCQRRTCRETMHTNCLSQELSFTLRKQLLFCAVYLTGYSHSLSTGFRRPSSKLCQNWLPHGRGVRSLSPSSCPSTLSEPSEMFGY